MQRESEKREFTMPRRRNMPRSTVTLIYTHTHTHTHNKKEKTGQGCASPFVDRLRVRMCSCVRP